MYKVKDYIILLQKLKYISNISSDEKKSTLLFVKKQFV